MEDVNPSSDLTHPTAIILQSPLRNTLDHRFVLHKPYSASTRTMNMAVQVQERVTPEELDAWLRLTSVDGEDIKPVCHKVQHEPAKKWQKKGSWRRRSSLDEDNISERPIFGIDANALLSSEGQVENQGEDEVATSLRPFVKRGFQGSESTATVVTNNHHNSAANPDFDEILSPKKRRVSLPLSERLNDQQDQTQKSNENNYCRLVTDHSYCIDYEAKFSRRSSQFTVPSRTVDQEAHYSRRSSQFNTNTGNGSMESFVYAMEVAQRSQNMLLDHPLTRSEEFFEATKESEMSRALLVKIGRRSVFKTMMNGNGNGMQSRPNVMSRMPAPYMGNPNNRRGVAAGLHRMMEEMKRAEQEEELRRHGLSF